MVFESGKYRIAELNEATAFISLFQNGLRNKKAEHLVISEKIFGNVPSSEPFSNQFFEGMSKIYELELLLRDSDQMSSEEPLLSNTER